MTRYLVLKRTEGAFTWKPGEEVDASSAEAAIRQAANGDGTYVAIPARSWTPVDVTSETKTVFKLSDATTKEPAPIA